MVDLRLSSDEISVFFSQSSVFSLEHLDLVLKHRPCLLCFVESLFQHVVFVNKVIGDDKLLVEVETGGLQSFDLDIFILVSDILSVDTVHFIHNIDVWGVNDASVEIGLLGSVEERFVENLAHAQVSFLVLARRL